MRAPCPRPRDPRHRPGWRARDVRASFHISQTTSEPAAPFHLRPKVLERKAFRKLSAVELDPEAGLSRKCQIALLLHGVGPVGRFLEQLVVCSLPLLD